MSVLVKAKSLFASKLFWLGVIQIATGVGELITSEVLNSDGAGWGAVVSGALTIVFRYLTKQPVTVSTSSTVKLVEGPEHVRTP